MGSSDEAIDAAWRESMPATSSEYDADARRGYGVTRYHTSDVRSAFVEGYRAAIRSLPPALESRAESGWVPCSERMPEAGARVIVSVGKGALAACRKGGPYDNVWIQYTARLSEATHWLPIPELPPLPEDPT